MAWFSIDMDDTLVRKEQDPTTGEEVTVPVEGAVEAMQELEAAGHRLTVFTARFAPMPDSKRQQTKMEIEAELSGLGFPEMEVWSGTTKPSADIFIDNKAVNFDGDWGLALAQSQTMLEERGLGNIQPDDGTMPEEAEPQMEQVPEEPQ